MKKKAKNLREGSGQKMDNLISIAEAARLRGVTHGAIQNLIERGRLESFSVAGRRLLRRGDVLSFEKQPAGRPAKPKDVAEKSAARGRARKKDSTRLLKTLS